MDLHELLMRVGRICRCPGCNQHRKAEPCTSYGTCRLPVWSEDGEDCFYCGSPVIKLADFCYYHEKFGNNGNGGGSLEK
jgi:hypothetical protein